MASERSLPGCGWQNVAREYTCQRYYQQFHRMFASRCSGLKKKHRSERGGILRVGELQDKSEGRLNRDE